MRTDLPAVILGCGPSAGHVTYRPDQYTLHAVNDAIALCDRADTLAINDVPVLARREQADFEKITTLLLPEHLHDDPGPRSLTSADDALISAEAYGLNRTGFIVETYLLHTDPAVKTGLKQPTFGRCRSTSDSLIAWLLAQGVRMFLTRGIEWDGRDGWAPGLPQGTPKAPTHRRAIWRYTVDRIHSHGGTVHPWSP